MAKKLEVRLYSRTTDAPVYKAIPLWKIAVVLLAIILAVVGFMTFDPVLVLKKLSDKSLFMSYVENKELIKTLSMVKDSVSDAEKRLLRLEEHRNRIAEQAGLPQSEVVENKEEAPVSRFGELGPARNMTRIRQAHATIRTFLDTLTKNPSYSASLPIIHPLVNHHSVTARFELVQDRHTGMELPHYGVDYATFEGDTVIAPGSGMVGSVRQDQGFGLTLTLIHNPLAETFYAHLLQTLVKPGQSIKRGQPIALVGKTGRTAGPHLHYELRILGQPVNPKQFYIAP